MTEIRKFDDAVIQRHIEEKLAELPADKSGAVVAHYDVTGRVALSVYGRLGGGFSYVGTVDWNKGGGLSGEAELRFTW